MPGGDRTGPLGRGARTGRAAGYCSGYPHPGYANPYPPRFGRGFGRGRGWGRGYWWRTQWEYQPPAIPDPYPRATNIDEEKTYLEQTIVSLENEIKAIKERLQEIAETTKKDTEKV